MLSIQLLCLTQEVLPRRNQLHRLWHQQEYHYPYFIDYSTLLLIKINYCKFSLSNNSEKLSNSFLENGIAQSWGISEIFC